ncbi:MAG: hypothetical protein H0Z29_11410 [Candidatus Marinimicrobia bacterium]|nr:hypothetical protein [Candidatus Neomarinimicrobiota bacterium]
MKTIIYYFTLSGNSKKISENLSKHLKSDVEEIVDKKNREGILRFFINGFDAIFERYTEIKKIEKKPSDYDLIIVTFPVWAGKIPPAIKTFFNTYKDQIKKYALFMTYGLKPSARAIKIIEEITEKTPLSIASISAKEIDTKKLNEEISDLKKNLSII